VKKLGSKKSGAKKGNYGLRGFRLFGIIDKVMSTNQMGSTKVDFQVPENHETRKHALDSILQAEYWKAQAITLIRRNPYV
jgi:hypothetical protein